MRRSTLGWPALVVVTLGSASAESVGPATAVPRFAYAANSTDNTISMYAVDAATGQLRHNGYLSGPSGTEGAYAVALDPRGQFAYVAHVLSHNVSAYAINANGTLAPVPGGPVGSGSLPLAIAVDPSSQFLFVANAGAPPSFAGSISAYRISRGSGALTPLAGSPFPTGTVSDALAIDPTGRYVYAANGLSNDVSAYAITPATGALTPVRGSPFPAGTVPDSLSVDPSGQFLYVTDYGDSSGGSSTISAFRIASTNGELSPVPGSPFPSRPFPTALTIDPLGQYAYTSNAGVSGGQGSVSGYALDARSGALREIDPPVPIGPYPSSPTVDPSAHFLYVLNGQTRVSVFSINRGNGSLSNVGTVSTRPSPISFVLSVGSLPVTPVPKFAYVDNTLVNATSGFTIDPTNGSLTEVSGSPFPRPPFPPLNDYFLASDPWGRFLYAGTWLSLQAYKIDTGTGALTAAGGQGTCGWGRPFIAVDPSGRFVYDLLNCLLGPPSIGPIALASYAIDQTTGALTWTGTVSLGVADPSFLALDPLGRFVYVTDRASRSVLAFRIDPKTGTLSAAGSYLSFEQPTSIAVHPSGRFAYVADQQFRGVMEYSIDGATGALTPVSYAGVSGNPSWVTADPLGRFVAVVQPDSNAVTVLSVDPTNGALSPLSTITTGQVPQMVAVDVSGQFAYVPIYGSNLIELYTISAAGELLFSTTFPAPGKPSDMVTTGTFQ